MLSLRLVSTDSFTSASINIDNDQSDNLDATFYITSNRVCRWLSTIHHADHLSLHTLLFLAIAIYISVHLFLSTLLLLFVSFIVRSVCACRMHRRKEKQGSSILTTTWSSNKNVWAPAPKLTSHVYPHSQHHTHKHYRTHHDSCDRWVTRERQFGWLALWEIYIQYNKILVIIIYLILFICMRI